MCDVMLLVAIMGWTVAFAVAITAIRIFKIQDRDNKNIKEHFRRKIEQMYDET